MPSRQAAFRAYAVALLTTSAAIATIFIFPLLQQRGAFMLLLAAVAISTWYGGWRAGALSAVLSAGYAGFYVLHLHRSDPLGDPDDTIRLALFLLIATLFALLHESRARALARAQRSEERLRLALEAARIAVWEYEPARGLQWWSEHFEEILGRPPVTFSSTYDAYLAYIHPQDRDFVKRAITRTIENGVSYEIEHRIVAADQSVRWVSSRGHIIYAESGRFDRIVGVVVDVTDRRDTDAGVREPAKGAPLPAGAGAGKPIHSG